MYDIHIRSLTYSVPYNTASVSGRVGRLCAHYTECFVKVLKGPKKKGKTCVLYGDVASGIWQWGAQCSKVFTSEK